MKIRASDRFAAVPQFVAEEASGNAVKLFALLYGVGSFDKPERTISRPKLAEMMKLSVDTVDRLVAELVTIGALAKQATYPGGPQGPNGYILAMTGGRTDAAAAPEPRGGGSRTDADPNARALPGGSEEEPHSTTAVINRFFEVFWNLYPYKRGRKEAARKAFAKQLRAGVAPPVILDGVRRFAADPNLPPKDEAQWVPHASTWLNDKGWQDGPLAPRKRPEDPPSKTVWDREL